jgi:hypothetical protein
MRPLAAILIFVILMFSAPLCAQRAQLARKGRQPETGKSTPTEPIRKLPRRGAAVVPQAAPLPERAMQSAPPLSEDRVRSLVRGTITPLPAAVPAVELARTLPRASTPVIPRDAAPAGVSE